MIMTTEIPKVFKDSKYKFVLVKPKTKIPFEKEWQDKTNYSFDDKRFQQHLSSNGNYGVLCGTNNLIVIDADTDIISKLVEDNLPETFTVKTGSGGKHFYFFSEFNKKTVLIKDGTHFGEIQGTGSQVIGPGSVHPNGNVYEIIKNLNIVEISEKLLTTLFKEFIERNKSKSKNKATTEYDDDLQNIKSYVKVEDVMSLLGFNTSINPTECLWHGSEGKANFGYDDDTWHCFHCEKKGNIFHLVMEHEGLRFGEAKKKIMDSFTSRFVKIKNKIIKQKTTLQDVYAVYNKWLHVSDNRRIDLVLSVALTREIEGTKLWLLIVSNSGDWKSEQLKALDDDGVNTRVIRSFTAKTLVSGDTKARDLAPELRDKLMLIPEMAQMLTLHPNEKASVWAQLRDLYDGIAGKDSGTGKSSKYEDLNITFIGCSTPAIDSQILIHQSLGSRELIYRPPKEDVESEKELMKKVLYNENHEAQMRQEIKEVTQSFLQSRKYENVNISGEILETIEEMANYLRFMRSPAEFDSYTGELLNDAHPEKPTRILKQLKRLFLALKSLDDNYKDEKALSVIFEVINSSSFQNRVSVYNFLVKHDGKFFTEYKISNALKIGRKSVMRELNVLWNLGLILKTSEEIENYGKITEKSTWSINVTTGVFSFLKNKYRDIKSMYIYMLSGGEK